MTVMPAARLDCADRSVIALCPCGARFHAGTAPAARRLLAAHMSDHHAGERVRDAVMRAVARDERAADES